MKTRHLASALLLALYALPHLAPAAHAADEHNHAHEHSHTPLHGGLVVEANDMDFELVAKPELITLYLRDHSKPASVKGASGKLILLTGTDKAEAPLQVAGDDRLEAKGPFKLGAGTKLLAAVQLPGKRPVNVRFVLK